MASSVTGADTSLYLLKTEENECFRIKLVQKRTEEEIKMRACWFERAQMQHCCGNASQSILIKMRKSDI